MKISGPINVIRMEGNINNINKVIHIFFDYHASLYLETECNNYENINIVNYLYNIFTKTTKTIDFFMEIKNSSIKKEISPYKNIYITNIAKLYNRSKFDKSIKPNIKENVRFHYIDIRDVLEKNIYRYIDILIDTVHTIYTNKDIFSSNFSHILEACMHLTQELELFRDYLNNKTILKQNNKDKNTILYFLDKITKKYKNNYVIEKINKSYINDIHLELVNCLNNIDELKKLILTKEKYVFRYYDEKVEYQQTTDIYGMFNLYYNYTEFDEFVYKIDSLGGKIKRQILHIFGKLTDLFFIRRFLDKEYITNAITYTGSAHSINFIYLLVSLFDFKITHFSYSDINDLDKLNKIAKEDINLLNYVLHPQKLIQCIDMTDFPQDF